MGESRVVYLNYNTKNGKVFCLGLNVATIGFPLTALPMHLDGNFLFIKPLIASMLKRLMMMPMRCIAGPRLLRHCQNADGLPANAEQDQQV